MRLQIFLGKIVLFLTAIWVIFCTLAFVLRAMVPLDPLSNISIVLPPVMDVTLFVVTLVGAVSCCSRLGLWIEGAESEKDEQ